MITASLGAALLLFTGDVMLSREVRRELTLKHGASPWSGMSEVFKGADWIMGNLEGSVGDAARCAEKDASLCFAVEPAMLAPLKPAGFTAMGVENNHSADLGASGRETTRAALSELGIPAVDFEHSPGFAKIKGHVLAFIALSNVAGKDGVAVDIPSNELRRKLRLARALADWVVVNVHWGAELADWPQPKQRAMAGWLVEQGADLIIGHHPHVVQAPECILGKPVFFSLGNHVFDQKYPQTKRGLLASCRISNDRLACSGLETRTPPNSAYPAPAPASPRHQAIESCSVRAARPTVVQGFTIRPRLAEGQFVDGEVVLEGRKPGAKGWNVVAKQLRSLAKGSFGVGKARRDFLFTLEAHPSSIDHETSPRPYVYDVGPHGLIARWRGSALAWPLVDGELLRGATARDSDYLCALHRKDSFVALDPTTKETRTALYRWNGFGFSGVDDRKLEARCASLFAGNVLGYPHE